MKLLRVSFLLVGVVVFGTLYARDIPVAVTVLERDDILLSKLPMNIDEVLFDIGRKGVKNSTVNIRPRGWSCEPQKSAWRCSGQAQENSYFSFKPVGSYRFSDKIKIEAIYQGREVFHISAATGAGVPELMRAAIRRLDEPVGDAHEGERGDLARARDAAVDDVALARVGADHDQVDRIELGRRSVDELDNDAELLGRYRVRLARAQERGVVPE